LDDIPLQPSPVTVEEEDILMEVQRAFASCSGLFYLVVAVLEALLTSFLKKGCYINAQN